MGIREPGWETGADALMKVEVTIYCVGYNYTTAVIILLLLVILERLEARHSLNLIFNSEASTHL